MDYTVQDEENRLKDFSREENIEMSHNYLRMEKGPKPLWFSIVAFSYRLRFTFFQHYFLIFTDEYLILLVQNEDYEFINYNMTELNYKDIQDFSFTRTYGYYCISFRYLGEDYYFYLSDRKGLRLLNKTMDKLTKSNNKTYSYKNLEILLQNNFRGLLQ